MIKCWVGLGGGGELALPTAVSWKFCYGTGTPCDSFWLRCLWDRENTARPDSWVEFFAEHEGERVFTGLVDECEVSIDQNGRMLEVSGREMITVYLLQNGTGRNNIQNLILVDR